jgi:drug/metabolite transporter (DMT)-like permease
MAFMGIGVFLLFVRTPVMPLESWLWTTGGGFGGALALVAFYKAMSMGSMTVIAPITAVIGLSVPVIAGVLSGERPSGSAWIGILLATIAVALVADVLDRHDLPTPPRVIWMAVAAGLGFGMIFVCMGNASHDHGVWPLFGQRLVSVPTVAAIALIQTRSISVPKNVFLLSIAAGVLDTSANGLYLLATSAELMSIVSVVVAMYPVATIFLAMTLDHERLHKSQGVGLLLAITSLVLISI